MTPATILAALAVALTPSVAFADEFAMAHRGPCDILAIMPGNIGLMSLVPIGWDFKNIGDPDGDRVRTIKLWTAEHALKMNPEHFIEIIHNGTPDRIITLQPGEMVRLPAATPEQAALCTGKPIS